MAKPQSVEVALDPNNIPVFRPSYAIASDRTRSFMAGIAGLHRGSPDVALRAEPARFLSKAEECAASDHPSLHDS
jgi:hypothetical protein